MFIHARPIVTTQISKNTRRRWHRLLSPFTPSIPHPQSQYPYKYVHVCVHLSNINNLYVKMRVALTIYLQFYFQLAAKPVLPLSLVG